MTSKVKPAAAAAVEVEPEPEAPEAAVLRLADIDDADERDLLAALCGEYRVESGRETAAKNSKTALMKEIAPLAGKLGIERGKTKLAAEGSAFAPGWELVQRVSSRTEIDPKRLLARGVSMADILYATVKKSSPYYTVVGVAKGKSGTKESVKEAPRQYGNGDRDRGESLLDSLGEADVDFVEGRDGDR